MQTLNKPAGTSLEANLRSVLNGIAEASARGVMLVAFPEMCLTGYCGRSVRATSSEQLKEAEGHIAASCHRHGVAAIVGLPSVGELGNVYNSAAVWGADGSLVGRHHKLQLVPPDDWATAGTDLSVFHVPVLRSGDWSTVPVSIIICHDVRYPELCRLPVLAGSRLVVLLSCEQWHDDLPTIAKRDGDPWDEERLQREIGAYRAQAQARAVENRVFLLHANCGGDATDLVGCSHGISKVISPTGAVLAEAPIWGTALVAADIVLSAATALYAEKSLLPSYAFERWWRTGLERVRHVRACATGGSKL
jgi:predicted amidohydrolase